MAVIKKLVKCGCGTHINFNFDSQMHLEDLTVSGKCPSCGKSMHVSVVSMGGESAPAIKKEEYPSEQALDEAKEELEIDDADYSATGEENINSAINELFD